MRFKVIFLMPLLLLIFPLNAKALIVINEIYADPADGIAGDANKDGVRSASNDEFIELFNFGSETIDISSWRINDASSVRHIFPNNTFLLPSEYIVIFGGGAPNLPGKKWQKASSGGLSLNNTAETISLFNNQNQLVQQVIYDSLANHDQSIVRDPQGSGAFVLHANVAGSQGRLYSPGEAVVEPLLESSTTVPEGPSLVYIAFSLAGIFLGRTRKYQMN